MGRGAVAGLVAAVAGLGVAEVVAGLHDGWRSPVLDVGDRVIDRVPQPVKQLAIDWFGTADKTALLVGIASLLGLYAVACGVLVARGRRRLGLVGVGLFGVVGAWAALSARTDPPLHVAVPSLVGAVVAGFVLAVLLRATPESADGSAVVAPSTSRRRFLAEAGGVAAIGVVAVSGGRWLQSRAEAALVAARGALPVVRRPLRPVPAAASAPGATPFFTPNDDFYRIDINLSVPRIDVDDWTLRVHGLVDREIELTMDELVDRGLVESDITLTCVSNEVGGRLLGTARWTGVRLDDLLDLAGVRAEADQVVGRSVDGYTCGFPVSALDGRDALVAIGMNGEPLPLEHGYPARLVVPGLYGYVSATKWLTEIELTRFDAFDQYWVPRGWDAEAPIKVSSRIDTPKGLAKVAPGVVPVAGVAWAQTRGIDAVQIRVDDGDWQDTALAAEVNESTWRQWSFAWDATPGRHELTVRAVERGGTVQVEDRTEPFPNGATGWHTIVVMVDA